jgi:hypothetical protein
MWSNEAVKKWWFRMGEIFGTRWYEMHGPEASNLWQTSITAMSMDRAGAVIEHFRTCGQAHPPTMSEVVNVGRTLRTPEKQSPRLPRPEVDSKKVEASIEQMRRSGSQRRNKFLPGESTDDYQKAMRESGLSAKEFEAQRLAKNGWAHENEIKHRDRLRQLAFNVSYFDGLNQ